MSTRVCHVILTDFVKMSRFECCFWSTQCIETYAGTCDNVKIGVFISLNVQWWSFTGNVVYWKVLHSIKAAFFELRKAMFTGATLVLRASSLLVLILTVKNQRQFILNVTWRWIVRKNGFDNQKWLYECYRSQSNIQI